MAEDLSLKIILLGEAGVGKTSILFRFKNDEFKEYRKATFIDHYSKRINVRGVDVDLCVWDTAGQETFRSIVRSYYRHADGVLLLYDVTDVTTFHILTRWLSDLRLDNEMSQIIIAGNKNEDPAKKSVGVTTVKNFAREEKLEYMEVSAKSGTNVEKVFHRLTEKILIERGILTHVAENNLPPPRVEEPSAAESATENMHVQGDSTEQQAVLSENNAQTPEKSSQLHDQRKKSIQLSNQREENIQLHYQPPERNTRTKKKGCC